MNVSCLFLSFYHISSFFFLPVFCFFCLFILSTWPPSPFFLSYFTGHPCPILLSIEQLIILIYHCFLIPVCILPTFFFLPSGISAVSSIPFQLLVFAHHWFRPFMSSSIHLAWTAHSCSLILVTLFLSSVFIPFCHLFLGLILFIFCSCSHFVSSHYLLFSFYFVFYCHASSKFLSQRKKSLFHLSSQSRSSSPPFLSALQLIRPCCPPSWKLGNNNNRHDFFKILNISSPVLLSI